MCTGVIRRWLYGYFVDFLEEGKKKRMLLHNLYSCVSRGLVFISINGELWFYFNGEVLWASGIFWRLRVTVLMEMEILRIALFVLKFYFMVRTFFIVFIISPLVFWSCYNGRYNDWWIISERKKRGFSWSWLQSFKRWTIFAPLSVWYTWLNIVFILIWFRFFFFSPRIVLDNTHGCLRHFS